MIAYSQDNIQIYFSGGKGFHINYLCPELSEIDVGSYEHVVKNACTTIAIGLKSLDDTIYDKTRIIRTPNSKHDKTGLYKIPITYKISKENSMEDIYGLARKQHKISDYIKQPKHDDDLLSLIQANVNKKDDIPTSKITKSELVEGIINGFETGSRNSGLFSFASSLHSRGITPDVVLALCSLVNNNSKAPLLSSEVGTIVNSAVRYPTFNTRELVKEQPGYKNSEFVTFSQAGELWKEQITKSGDFSLGDRFPHINEVMNVTLLGDLIGIVANSGVGKSTLVMDLVNCLSNVRNTFSAFFSLEMASHACFFRAATITYQSDENGEVSSKKVAYDLLHDQELMKKVGEEWNRILILDKGSISLERIEEYSLIAKEITGNRLGSIIIDYGQYIEGASVIDKVMQISRNIKDVIKRLDVIGILNLQCNKEMKNSYIKVEDHHIEGIKAWKQVCDYIMAFWKSVDDNKRLHGKFLKTRWEKDDTRFDMVRDGLKYHTEVEKPDIREYNSGL